MKRTVTVHRVADRHRDLHSRDFADTQTVTVEVESLGDAIATALAELGLADERGKVIVTVERPHD